METDLIQNGALAPDMQGIAGYIEGNAQKRWQSLLSFIEQDFGAKPLIAYSTCAGKPGWNVKFKKSGKALCTLYPEKQSFIALVVLNTADMLVFDTIRSGYTDYINALYDKCKLFNGTKWLMTSVTDDAILEDVKKMLKLKTR
jgi:hypothetical protein